MCGSCGSSSHCWGREIEEHWCGCYGLSLGVSWIWFRMLTAGHCLPAVGVLRTSWTSCCYSVTKSCLAVCDLVNCSLPGSFAIFWSLLKFMSFESMMPSNHLILCCPLLLLPSIFPSIRVFSNESVLGIRWPRHWSFSFRISPLNEYIGFISFKIDWFDLLAVQGTLKSFQTPQFESINSSMHRLLYGPMLTSIPSP